MAKLCNFTGNSWSSAEEQLQALKKTTERGRIRKLVYEFTEPLEVAQGKKPT